MMPPSFHTTKAALIACVATAAFGLGGHAPGLAQESKPEYAIKEDIPGSRIRSNAIEFNSVALNLPYSELSAQDRANLHSWWAALPDGDEPPFPATGLKPILNAVYNAQATLLVEGDLYLIATVDPTGKVADVKVMSSPNPEMTKFAASVLLLTKFKPGVCSGKPCRMDFPIRYNFVRR